MINESDPTKNSEKTASKEINEVAAAPLSRDVDEAKKTSEGAPGIQAAAKAAEPGHQTSKRLIWIKQKASQASLADWLTAVFTLIIAVATVAYVVYARRQWREMKSGSADTHDLAVSAQQQAIASAKLADQAKAQTEKLGESIEKTDDLVRATSALAEQAKRSADIMNMQLKATQQSANAATSAADTATKQLELTDRPWVDATIALDGPFSFDINGANIPLKVTLRNTGHSPALSVVISPLPLLGSKGMNAANYREQVCQDATRTATTAPQFGVALFPNANFEERMTVGIGKQDIEDARASKEFPGSHFGDVILSPSVVICIAYRPTFNQTSVYHTVYVVNLLKLDSENRLGFAFKIGEDVDQEHLLLRLGVAGAITAN
ncbi:MAG: hypothetical protein ACLQMT_01760 [Candidatus Acidiferrales bacterium]